MNQPAPTLKAGEQQHQMNPVQLDQEYRQQADYYPKIQTMYRDQYQVKDIKNHHELIH